VVTRTYSAFRFGIFTGIHRQFLLSAIAVIVGMVIEADTINAVTIDNHQKTRSLFVILFSPVSGLVLRFVARFEDRLLKNHQD
jgi:hypothetical protein